MLKITIYLYDVFYRFDSIYWHFFAFIEQSVANLQCFNVGCMISVLLVDGHFESAVTPVEVCGIESDVNGAVLKRIGRVTLRKWIDAIV